MLYAIIDVETGKPIEETVGRTKSDAWYNLIMWDDLPKDHDKAIARKSDKSAVAYFQRKGYLCEPVELRRKKAHGKIKNYGSPSQPTLARSHARRAGGF